MKKLLSVSFMIIAISSYAFSQRGVVSVGIGPSMGFAVSNVNYSYYYKNGIGGSIQADFGVTKLGSITTNLTFLSIGSKHAPTSRTSLAMLRAGYRTGFSNSGFFAAADAGLRDHGYFVIGGTVGYSFKVSKGSYIDLFPSYILIFGSPFNNMWLTGNVLYRFNLNKKSK